jgi:hypothetical protein
MATVAYTAFYDEILPEAPGCLPALALNAIRNAVIEFCEKSHMHIYNHPAISAIANTPTYVFVPLTGTLVVKALQVFYNGTELIPKTPDELKNIYDGDQSKDWRDQTGEPIYFTQDDARNIRLVPMPSVNAANAIKMRVSLKPTRASTAVDDKIFEEHLETIKHGALYRLKIQKGKPYSDEPGAAQSFIFFNNGIQSAKTMTEKGFGRARQRVVPHYF